MSGTRALFTSIGVSFSLVAAAALSLLAVSAVFAFGGWSDPVVEPINQAAIVLAELDGEPPPGAEQSPVVLAEVTRSEPRRKSSRPARTTRRPARSTKQVAPLPDVTTHPTVTAVAPSESDVPAETVAPASVVEQRKSLGNGLRTAGQDLSTTVEDTGSALAQVTQPLAPPVSSAMQKIMNLVATLLRRATGGLGDVVDGLLPAK